MANTIITKNSATATAVPTAGQLVQGELAVNVTDKRLFTENSGGTVVEVGTNPSTIAVAGNATVGGTLGVTGLATLASSTLTTNPTLSAGTANGVTYLNGSKVLTSGSALTFDGSALAVTGTLSAGNGISYFNNLDANIMLRVGVGITSTLGTGEGLEFSFTAPTAKILSYNRATSAYKNIFIDALTQSFGISGSEGMRLTSTGLGIGTSSPNQAGLDKAVSVNGTSSSIVEANVAGGRAGYMYAASQGTVIGEYRAKTLQFTTSDTVKATLDSSGNLGLGVTPSAWWSSQRTFQIGRSSSVSSRTDIGLIDINDNNYTDAATNVIYIADGAASKYRQNSGSHQWLTAPSGTAGDAISFTQAMTLDASGNLGIGTTSISGKLSINGEVYAAAGSVSGVAYGFYPKGTYGNTGMFSPAANTVAFATTGGERMRIDSSGNVGIGTSTIGTDGVSLNSAYNIGWTQSAGESVPNIFRQSSSAATVVANGYRYTATSNGFASSFSSSFAKSAISVGDGSVRFYTDTAATTAAGTDVTPTERLRIDSSGNLLVGTTSLYGGEKLALVQSTNNRGFVIQQTNASNTSPPFLIDCSRNTTNETYNALAYYNSGAGVYRFYVTDNGGGYFNGNLLVGTTTGNARLTIKEEANLAEADSHIEIVGSGYSGFHWLDGTAYYIGQNSSIREVRIYSGAETAGVVLGAGGTSWSTFSDERLKYDIQPINDGLTKLANIRCVSYRLKDVDAEDSQKKLGVIAQDLVGVVDEVISITKKTGDETDYMSVRYTELIPVLIKAIQEQQAIIESLKARLDAANI
jgi:hypothetical protein